MKILAVDTATAWQSVALLDDDAVLARSDQQAAGSHGRSLLPTIDRLFCETGLSLRQLDGLAVSIGPGSFTGLRIGLATMLGFRTISGLPLAVIPTLEGMAWNLQATSGLLCPVLNSRKGELYWAVFRWRSADRVEQVHPEEVGPPARLGTSLSGATLLFGEGWLAESSAIRASLARSATIVETTADAGKPSAVSVGLAGIAKLRRGESAGVDVAPLYVQRAEAELKYEQSGGTSPLARRLAKVARNAGGRLAVAEARRRLHK